MFQIMISVFRPEEISAWVDLSLEGLSPELYLFRLEGNKVVVHMEKLENGTRFIHSIKTIVSILSCQG